MLDVGLYWLGALRGLWGFCARVELGGFMACCVFAFLLSFCLSLFAFLLLTSFSSLYLLFVLRLVCFVLVVFWLSSCLVLFVLVVFVVVSFSLSDYTQKERTQRFCSLRPLFVCY